MRIPALILTLIVVNALRAQVPYYVEDRFFAPDIEAANALLSERVLTPLLPSGVLPSLA